MFKIFKLKKDRPGLKNITYETCEFNITKVPSQINEPTINDEPSKFEQPKVSRHSSACKICGASVLNENETVCDTCKSMS